MMIQFSENGVGISLYNEKQVNRPLRAPVIKITSPVDSLPMVCCSTALRMPIEPFSIYALNPEGCISRQSMANRPRS